MTEHLLESFGGFDDFLIYFAVCIMLLCLFNAIYVRITPYREIALIRSGNTAAALSLSGAMLGFVLPLASAVVHGVSLVDTVLWGVLALLVQLLAYAAVRLMIPSIAQDIPDGKVAQGLFLGALSLGVGILNAACMSS